MRTILLFSALFLAALPANAQVITSGNITVGHAAIYCPGAAGPGQGVICDAGPSLAGSLTEIGITNTGTPFCINDAATSGPYHQFCLGANLSGHSVISTTAYGGAFPTDFQVVINGIAYPFPGSGSGNVVGPNSSTAQHVPVFNNAGGTLLADSAALNGGGALSLFSLPGGFSVNAAPPNASVVSWTKDSSIVSGVYAYLANFGELVVSSPYGEMAASFASRTGDTALPGVCCSIAASLFQYNNNTVTPQAGWGLYSTSVRVAGAGTVINEIDIANLGNDVVLSPYTLATQGLTSDLWVACGGESATVRTLNHCSTAMTVLTNGSTFDIGLMFQNNSLTVTPDHGYEAIALPFAYGLTWYEPSTGLPAAFINSLATDHSNPASLLFQPGGYLQFSGANNAVFIVSANATFPAQIVFGNTLPYPQLPTNVYSIGRASAAGNNNFFINYGAAAAFQINPTNSLTTLGISGAALNLNAPVTIPVTPGAFSATKIVGLYVGGVQYYFPASTSAW